MGRSTRVKSAEHGKIFKNGPIYTRDGSSVKTNHLSSINTGRTMIRTIVASRSSSRIYTRRIIRLSVTKRHGYKANRHLADPDF